MDIGKCDTSTATRRRARRRLARSRAAAWSFLPAAQHWTEPGSRGEHRGRAVSACAASHPTRHPFAASATSAADEANGARAGIMPTRDPAWPMIPSGGGLPTPPPPSPPAAAAAVAASSSRHRPPWPPRSTVVPCPSCVHDSFDGRCVRDVCASCMIVGAR